MTRTRLAAVLTLIDEANRKDPTLVQVGEERLPAELAYGRRMSATLSSFSPGAGELVQIAARGQHIERWTSPRKGYPEGRIGYLKWRTDLKHYHARRVGELMRESGYGEEEIARAGQLIRKERLAHDPEVQTLEDVICLVFLKYYASDFAALHEDGKVTDILAKTARKMSAAGLAAAGRLELPERLSRLLAAALAGTSASG